MRKKVMQACVCMYMYVPVCVRSDTNYTHMHTHNPSLPSANVIFSRALQLRAVLVWDEANLGKHPADTLAQAGHDTEPPLLF